MRGSGCLACLVVVESQGDMGRVWGVTEVGEAHFCVHVSADVTHTHNFSQHPS